MQKGIITVVGKDQVGIIAKVCTYLAKKQVNILDISQTILYFSSKTTWTPIKDASTLWALFSSIIIWSYIDNILPNIVKTPYYSIKNNNKI